MSGPSEKACSLTRIFSHTLVSTVIGIALLAVSTSSFAATIWAEPAVPVVGQPYTINWSTSGDSYYWFEGEVECSGSVGSCSEISNGQLLTGNASYRIVGCNPDGNTADCTELADIAVTAQPIATPTPVPGAPPVNNTNVAGENVNLGDINYDIYYHASLGFYFHAKEQFILLHGDIATPIIIPPGLEFRIPSQLYSEDITTQWGIAELRGTYYDDTELYAVTPPRTEEELQSQDFLKLEENVHFYRGDFDGDGDVDIAFRDHAILGSAGYSTTTQQTYYNPLTMVLGGQLHVVSISTGSLAWDHGFSSGGLSSTSYTVVDYDGDGRDDLVRYGGVSDADNIYNLNVAGANVSLTSYENTANTSVKAASLNGASAGSFRVDESGAAIYNIPISLPAGTAGVAPELSLNYSSNAGNGIVGKGWSLGGLSSINRCPQTLVQDGQTKPISWSNDDRYCYNGKRLKETSASGSVGALKWKEYRSEIESFVVVRGFFPGSSSDFSNPEYFTVEAKDGSKSYFGSNDATHTTTDGKRYVWSIDRYYDSVGNRIEYDYTQDSNAYNFRLTNIRYAFGNDTLARAQVELQYGSRRDYIGGYVAGYKFKTTKRLENIVVSNNESSSVGGLTDIRAYNLYYRRDSQDDSYSMSYLTQVQECDNSTASANCLQPTVFDWSEPNRVAYGANSVPTDNILSGRSSTAYLIDTVPMDINGDGYQDMVWTENHEYHHKDFTRIRYGIYDPAVGNFVQQDFHSIINGDDDEIGFPESGDRHQLNMFAIDYNVDGRKDLAVLRDSHDRWEIFLSVPTGLNQSGTDVEWRLSLDRIIVDTNNPFGILMDANSDGLTDIVSNDKIYYQKRDSSEGASSSERYHYDVSSAVNVSWQGFNQPHNDADNYSLDNNNGYHSPKTTQYFTFVQAGDFNGDGSADAIVADVKIKQYDKTNSLGWYRSLRQENYYLAIRQGNTFVAHRYLGTDKEEVNSHWGDRVDTKYNQRALTQFYGVDVNGDNNVDLIKGIDLSETSDAQTNLNAGYELYINTGTAFAGSGELTGGTLIFRARSHDSSSLRFRDIDSDGFTDVTLRVTGGSAATLYWNDTEERYKTLDGRNYMVSYPNNREATAARYLYFDIDSDGRVDQITYSDQKLRVAKNIVDGPVDVITNITNGLGADTDIHYEVMSQSDHYIDYMEGMVMETDGGYAECLASPYYPAMHDCTPPSGGSVTEFNKDAFYTLINTPFNHISDDQSFVGVYKSPIFEAVGGGWLVTAVEGDAPAASESNAGQINQSATSRLDYYYKHARFQAAGMGMLGFAELMTIDPLSGVKTATHYRQDWPFVGMPYKTESFSANNEIMSRSENSWGLVGWNTSWPSTYAANDDGISSLGFSINPYMKENSQTTYAFSSSSETGDVSAVMNGSSPVVLQTVKVENKYDSFGNPYEVKTTTEGDGLRLVKTIKNAYDTARSYGSTSAAGPNLTLVNGGGLSRSVSYRELGRVTGTQVKTKRNAEAETTRTSHFTYYQTGDGIKAGLIKSETIEPGDSEFEVITTYDYDARGNKVHSQTEAVNHQYNRDGFVASSVKQTRTQAFIVDDSFRYVDETQTIINSGATADDIFSKEIVAERNKYGSPSRIESRQNNNVININYDLLGREIYRGDSTGTWTTTEYLTCSQVSHCPAGTTYAVRARASGGNESITYYDILARVIRTATRSFTGSWNLSDTEFDSAGRTLRASEPYSAGSSPAHWTRNYYNVLGQAWKTQYPDGAEQTIGYSGYTSTIVNDLGQTRTETKNGLGELIEVEAADGGSVIYGYNSRGQMNTMTAVPNAIDLAAGKGNIVTALEYDDYDRKLNMVDPDKGRWEYQYNAFGELAWQKDANGQVVLQKYDTLGRMTHRTDYTAAGTVENHTRWYFDGRTDTNNSINAVANAGNAATAVVMTQSSSQERCDSATAVQCVYPSFDEYGRGESSTVTNHTELGEQSFTTGTIYDNIGRVLIQTDALHGLVRDASGSDDSGTYNHYNAYGYLNRVTDLTSAANGSGQTIYQALEINARGQVTRDMKGNGFEGRYTYDDETGRLTRQRADIVSTLDNAGLFKVQDISYVWDTVGNLTSRHNQSVISSVTRTNKNLRESFGYDSINRLAFHYHGTLAANAGSAAETNAFTYDSFGNMATKEGVGTYTYGNDTRSIRKGGRHAVVATSGTDGQFTYEYDENGNVINDTKNGVRNRTFTYSTFDKPLEIIKGQLGNPDHTTQFSYGISRGRFWRKDVKGNGDVTTTEYLDGVEKVYNHETNQIEWKRYLGSSAIFTTTTSDIKNSSGQYVQDSYKERYTYKDHLGSVDVITDGSGTIVQALSFDPWGGRRSADDWQVAHMLNELVHSPILVAELNSETTRGFTGHEMLDEVGIIHMNGRIYDPRLARFLQADPIIQAATNTQSLNRYSYTTNNPLNATDPSGYKFFREVRANFKAIFTTVIAIVATVACLGTCTGATYMAVMAAVSAVGAAINGADGNGILIAAIGGVFGAAAGGGADLFQKVAISAVVGGITSVMQGGKFGHGFVSGAVSSSFAPVFKGINSSILRIGAQAIVGGTVSKLTGGKFENGAASAAFSAAVSAGLSKVGGGEIQGDRELTLEEERAKAILNGSARGTYGAEREITLPDGSKIKLQNYTKSRNADASTLVVTADQEQAVLDSFNDVSSNGGTNGKELLNGIAGFSKRTPKIIFNDQKLNFSGSLYGISTIDPSNTVSFRDRGQAKTGWGIFKQHPKDQATLTRTIVHEFGHAILGKDDYAQNGNVPWVDGVMQGINGTIRGEYSNDGR